MAVTVNLRKLLHRKSVEYCNPLPVANAAGGFVVSDKSDVIPGHNTTYYVGGVSVIYNYNADQDGFVQVPNSGAAGVFGAGSCGEFRALSAPGGAISLTATGGGVNTINTNLTAAMNAKGCRVRVLSGAGVGFDGTIVRNSVGANSVLTVTGTISGSPASPTFDATTVFQLFVGSVWFFNAGTSAVGFVVLDRFTNAWTARSVTGLPTAWGTDAQLVATGSSSSNNGAGFVNGTASAGTSTTLSDASKSWPTNGWTNAQVRIKSGTGVGQIRSIASNTATQLTVSSAWTVTPDTTSQYVIEGNDDYFYLLGNNAVALYRYSISGNAWTTLTPVAARAGGFGAGGTADWIDSVPSWAEGQDAYTNQVTTTVLRQMGRYIYSFRGAATNILDIYDIAANTWISAVPYGNQAETFTTGSSSLDVDGGIYYQKESTGRVFRFDVAAHSMEPFTVNPVTQSTVTAGDKMFVQTFKEGATTLRWLYTFGHTIQNLVRFLIV